MQVEGAIGNSVELLQATLGVTPEALYPVDVMRAGDELVIAVVDSEVLRVPDIDKAVVAAPAVGVDGGVNRDATANNGLKSSLFTVRHDLSVNRAVAFEDAEDDGLAAGSAASLATQASSAEVRFVNFDFAGRERRGALTLLSNALSYFEKDRGDAAARESCQLSHVTGRQIEREVAHESAHFTLANFRPLVIAV